MGEMGVRGEQWGRSFLSRKTYGAYLFKKERPHCSPRTPPPKYKREENMDLFSVTYVLIFIIFALIVLAVIQIKMTGMKIKDFWHFIEANEMLDKLYNFSKQYQNLTQQEQVIFLAEAEKVFSAFEKVPDMLWEEEYQKYLQVLNKYKDIRVVRWSNS